MTERDEIAREWTGQGGRAHVLMAQLACCDRLECDQMEAEGPREFVDVPAELASEINDALGVLRDLSRQPPTSAALRGEGIRTAEEILAGYLSRKRMPDYPEHSTITLDVVLHAIRQAQREAVEACVKVLKHIRELEPETAWSYPERGTGERAELQILDADEVFRIADGAIRSLRAALPSGEGGSE